MPYYKYYQTNEKEPWQFVVDNGEEALKELKAKRVSILSVDRALDNLEDKASVKYKGDMYFDIDSKDLSEAIESTRTLVNHLLENQIEEDNLQIFCSGSKGFHVIVHRSAFYDGNGGKRHLPRIYKRLAANFHVPGLDYQPYSAGKGNLFRLPNVKRDDGKYKVQITLSELGTITSEKYQELTSKPRTDVSFMPLKPVRNKNARLLLMFQQAEEEVKREIQDYKNIIGIDDKELNEASASAPPCISDIADGRIKQSANFNQAALQMATFLSRYKVSKAEKESYIARFAANADSTTYTTEAMKISHLRGLMKYVSEGNRFPFACGPIRSIISTKPCDLCSLNGKSKELLDNEDPKISEDSTGYRIQLRKAGKRLTNFTVIPTKEISHMDNDSGSEQRHKIVAGVYMESEYLGEAELYNDTWSSRRTFLEAFAHLPKNVSCFANDQEVQMLKEYILENLEDVDYQVQVGSVGIYRDRPKGRIRYTWVEPTMSINRFGMKDTHIYARERSHGLLTEDRLKSMPSFVEIPTPIEEDPYAEAAIYNLLNINEPRVMAPIIGWLSACNLKSHFMGRFGQFPLLNLWGGRGSGKTRTAVLATALCGCNYFEHSPHVASSTTLFPIYSEMSSTTTVPRVIDEFNRLGCGVMNYNKITEAMKQAYNGASVHRGAIARGKTGAIVSEMPMTAPIMYMSEHIPDVPALQDRTISVMMSEKSLRARKQHERYVGRHFADMYPVARAMAMSALTFHEDALLEQIESYEDKISDELSDRQRYAAAVVLVGLDYFKKIVCGDLKISVGDLIDEMHFTYLSSIRKGEDLHESFLLVGGGNATEIDGYLRSLSEMTILSQSDHTIVGPSPQMVRRDGEFLKIDIPAVFAALQFYILKQGGRRPLSEASQFHALLMNEPYYMGAELDTEMTQDRPVAILSLEKMARKGIDTSCY